MTVEQKKKVLQRIAIVQGDIEKIQQARIDIASSGYASATLASTGGSKSYTRLDLQKLTDMLAELTSELRSLRNLIAGRSGTSFQTVLTVYS